MFGLLLRLQGEEHHWAGASFRRCFKPLRSKFDQYFWILSSQPWMGSPTDFHSEKELARFEGDVDTSVSLWRRGSIGRWADQFSEEDIELWAPNPTTNPSELATEFSRVHFNGSDAYIESHAEIWLIYTDSTCWEIFTKEVSLLQKIREHLVENHFIEVYESSTKDRRRAFKKAGLDQIWRAR
ncbi:hypothetical protein K2Y11_14610 [bacterium]|nr:hypothetical protein [bacterium]